MRALAGIRRLLQEELGDEAPDIPEPEPFVAPTPPEVDVDGVGAVVFTAGFRPDYGSWVRFPVFDEQGFPITDDGLSTAVPGLYCCGVHFLRNRRSALIWGAGVDAGIVARALSRDLVTR